MLESWRQPWWKAVLVGVVLTLVALAVGAWQLTVMSAAVAGFLAGRGRAGGVRGIQAAAPAWILWLVVLSVLAPVEDLVLLLGSILGAGWGLVVLLMALIPILLGAFGGMAGGYLAELLSKEGSTPEPAADSDRAAR